MINRIRPLKKAILFLISAAFTGLTPVQSQVFKTVHVETAGMLNSLVSPEEMTTVTDLALTGTINLEDYNTMRTQMPSLKAIDLRAVQTEGDSIPGDAFKTDITALILPSSITKIGYRAICNCNLLTTISIPPSVTHIGKYAFAGCRSLQFIELPDSLKFLGQQAFVACDSMSTIRIPPGITTLGAHVFEGCYWMDSITIGSSVTSIGSFAFAGCANLKTLTIPASVDSIAAHAFVSCTGLSSVTFNSSSETSIGEYAFAGNSNLKSVTLNHSDGISLGKYAFVGCPGLETLHMDPQSVTSIGEGCFINAKIDSLVLPSSLTFIERLAFAYIDSLRSLVFLPSAGTTVGESAFAYCSNLASVIMESPSVDSIGLHCFLQCVKLTRVTLPSSLTYVGDYAFRDCHLSGTLIMPSALAHIGQYAFNHQDIDTLIFMPSEGAYLGDYSFAHCPNLVSIIMYSPSVDTFGQRCFSDCQMLKNVILPSSLTSIQYGAFGWCNQLQWFRINSTTPPVLTAGNEVFPYWSGGVIDLYVPAGTQEAYQVAAFWNRFHIIGYDLHLSADRDTVMITDTGGTYGLTITSSVNWQASQDQQWLGPVRQSGWILPIWR